MEKSLQLKIDLEAHQLLEKIQQAECEKFALPKRRRKEDLAKDIFLLGMKHYIHEHNLNGHD